MKTKHIIWILMIVLLASSVLAATKPIAAQVVNGQGTIELFVEIDFLGQNQTCVINPLVETGPDGSFSTNLGNLVFIDFPQIKCDSFWKAEDRIRYKIEYENEIYQSEPEEIKLGTGLQYLENLILPEPETPPSPPSSGGGGGGGSSSSEETTTPIAPITPIIPVIKESIPEVEAQLSKDQQDKSILAHLNLNPLNNVVADIEIKVILSDKSNSFVIETKTDKISLKQQEQRDYNFDLSQLTPRQYKIQGFVFYQNKLITVSNVEVFQIEAPPAPLEELPIPDQEVKFSYGFYLLILALTIIMFTTYKAYKKIKSRKKK